MAWTTPTLADLIARAKNAFRGDLSGADAWVPQNNLAPTAKAVAGANYELFLRLDGVAKNIFALFAEGAWLDDHASENGVAPRKPAQAATGVVNVTTTDSIVIPAGANLQRSDGITYAVTATASQTGAGTLAVNVLATTTGATTNCAAGTPLNIVAGPQGQFPTGNGAATAQAAVGPNGIAQGADVEQDGPPRTADLSTLRGRVLFRKRNPPQGGAASDYVQWASGVPGVTRVFVQRALNGLATVYVYPMFDDLFPGGIPDSAHVQNVAAEIAPSQPSAATVVVAAPAPSTIAIVVSNLSPNTNATQQAVIAALNDALTRFGRVSGADVAVAGMPYLASPFTFEFGWIDRAVQDADGVVSADVTANGGTADIVLAAGSAPLFSVTF